MRQDFGESYNLHRKDRRLLYRNDKTALRRIEVWKNYKQFIKDSKVSQRNYLTSEQVAEITDTIFEEIERSWIENEAGILIRNFGYFTVLSQKKKTRPTVAMIATNFHFFHPVFVPFHDDSDLKFYSMDGSIRRRIKNSIIRRSHQKYKYRNMLYTMKDELRMSSRLIAHRRKIRQDGEL